MSYIQSTASASLQEAVPEKSQPMDDIFQDALDSFLEDFKTRLTKNEEDSFRNTTLVDVKREITDIQKKHGEAKTMMNCNRLKSFLEAMDQWGQVVAVFANSSELVAFVWGPVKFLLLVCRLTALSNPHGRFREISK